MAPQMVILLDSLLIIITIFNIHTAFKTLIFQSYQRKYYLCNILAGKRVKVDIDMVNQKAIDSVIKSVNVLMSFSLF